MQFTWIILKLSLPYTLLVHGNITFLEISPWYQKYGGPLLYRKTALPLQDSARSGANLSSLASAPCVGRKQASCFRSPPLWACRCCVMVRFGTEFLAAAQGAGLNDVRGQLTLEHVAQQLLPDFSTLDSLFLHLDISILLYDWNQICPWPWILGFSWVNQVPLACFCLCLIFLLIWELFNRYNVSTGNLGLEVKRV